MAHRSAKVAGVAAGALALVGVVVVLTAEGDEDLGPAARAVAGLPAVTDFSMRAGGGACVYDEDSGGLVYRGLTVASRSNGKLELAFYAQRGSLDDVLPGYVSTVLTFDADSRSHTFDLVIPVTKEEHEAGYDECIWSTGGA